MSSGLTSFAPDDVRERLAVRTPREAAHPERGVGSADRARVGVGDVEITTVEADRPHERDLRRVGRPHRAKRRGGLALRRCWILRHADRDEQPRVAAVRVRDPELAGEVTLALEADEREVLCRRARVRAGRRAVRRSAAPARHPARHGTVAPRLRSRGSPRARARSSWWSCPVAAVVAGARRRAPAVVGADESESSLHAVRRVARSNSAIPIRRMR